MSEPTKSYLRINLFLKKQLFFLTSSLL